MGNLFDIFFSHKADESRIEEKFENWLKRINKEENINPSIIGFYFGLFKSEDSYIMYLTGSKSFSKENEDWAAETNFEPKSKYFDLGKKFSKNKEWEEILKYSENLINNYIHSEKFQTSILSKAIAIATGFDDGNLIIVYSVD